MNGSDADSSGRSGDQVGKKTDQSRRRKGRGDRGSPSDAGGAGVGGDQSNAAKSINQLADLKRAGGKQRDQSGGREDAAGKSKTGKDRAAKGASDRGDKGAKRSAKGAKDDRGTGDRKDKGLKEKTMAGAGLPAQNRDGGTGKVGTDSARHASPDKARQPGVPRARWAAGAASAAQQTKDRSSARAPAREGGSQFALVNRALMEHEAQNTKKKIKRSVTSDSSSPRAKWSAGKQESAKQSTDRGSTKAPVREGGSQWSLLTKALMDHDGQDRKTKAQDKVAGRGDGSEAKEPSLLDFARTGDATIAYLRYLEKKLANQAKPGATDQQTAPERGSKGPAIPRWLASFMEQSKVRDAAARNKGAAGRTAPQRTESVRDRDQATTCAVELRRRQPTMRTFLSAGRTAFDNRADQRSLDRARLGLSSHRIRLDAAGAFNRAAMRRTMFRYRP